MLRLNLMAGDFLAPQELDRTETYDVIGFIASDTFKTLVSFRHLRKTLLEMTRIRSMIELGFGVFEADVSCGMYFLETPYVMEQTNQIHFLDARGVKKSQSASELLKQLEAEEKNAGHSTNIS